MKFYPPTAVSINAQSDEAKALGEQYVREAKVMLIGLRGRQQDGVQIVGQTRTLPNGVRIKVGMSDNGVSQMGWVQIDVPEVIKPVPPEYEREEKRGDYIWIGLKTVSGGKYTHFCPGNGTWEDPEDPDEQIGWPILWVWEPPAENELPGIISAWREMLTLYHEPVIPDLDGGTRLDGTGFTTGPGTFIRLPSGAYMIHRYPEDPGIISPVTEEEDGEDLWHQIFVMDPGDGAGTVNVRAFYDQDPLNPQDESDHFWLASRPTYLMPDHPDYVDDDHQPHNREQPSPATVMWASDPDWQPTSDGGEDQKRPSMPYLAKVFYLTPSCDEVTPVQCKLKVISGKMPLTTIDRYDFTIERGNWKPRAALPRGVYDSIGPDWKGNEIPAGDNVMDHGWSTETWEVNPMFGSRIADESRMPFGLNQGELDELECQEPHATLIVVSHHHAFEVRVGEAPYPTYVYVKLPDPAAYSGGIYDDGRHEWWWMWAGGGLDRCGESTRGFGPDSVFAGLSSGALAYDTGLTIPKQGTVAQWIPGTPVNVLRTKAVEWGMEFYSEIRADVLDEGSSGWHCFLMYLPLTNEWVEFDPLTGMDEMKKRLFDLGYAYMAGPFAGLQIPTFE